MSRFLWFTVYKRDNEMSHHITYHIISNNKHDTKHHMGLKTYNR